MQKNRTQNARRTFARRIAFGIVALTVAVLLIGSLIAAPPPAGQPIGNQANATYTDPAGNTQSTTSNTVTTTVQQVYAFAISAGSTFSVAPGTQVVMAHTITNNSNGSDTFQLSAAAAAVSGANTFQPTGIQIFADADNNNVPDNSTDLNVPGNTVSIAAGGSLRVIVLATVPGTLTAGQQAQVTITTNDSPSNYAAQSATDTIRTTGNAAIQLTKSYTNGVGGATINSGAADGTTHYTVNLTYKNNGINTASNVTITDALPAGFAYVAGSGKWSTTTLTDTAGNNESIGSVGYTIQYSAVSGTVTAVISSVAPNIQGTFTFDVTVPTGTAAGTITNTANGSYDDGSGTTVNTSASAGFTVAPTSGVTGTGDTVATAVQGTTVYFKNTFTNTGNVTDTFNVQIVTNNLPGTVTLLKSDKLSNLVDSNTTPDGIADTGPLAPGASYDVWVKVVLPSNYTTSSAITLTKKATSTYTGGGGANVTVTDTLSAVTAASVDVTNNAAVGGSGVLGTGAFASDTAVKVTQSVNPGVASVFTVYVNNTTTGLADTYNLYYTTSNSTTAPSGNSAPAGWNVQYYTPSGSDCSTYASGTVTTNTGSIAAGSNKLVCAVVTPASNATPGTTNLYFWAVSTSTSAADAVHDAVTVNSYHALSMSGPNTNNVFPGGSVVYLHTITNNGNVAETIAINTVEAPNPVGTTGWASAVYVDTNSNGTLDAGTDTAFPTDPSVSGYSLAVGASVQILVKVTAPNQNSGSDRTTVNVSSLSSTTVSAYNDTTIVTGNLRLYKFQTADADCNAVEDGSYATTSFTVAPGKCVMYLVVARNEGPGTLTVNMTDAIPTYTALNPMTAGTVTATGCLKTPPGLSGVTAGQALTGGSQTANGCWVKSDGTAPGTFTNSSGTISLSGVTLNSGQYVQFVFGVKVNQ